MYFGLQTILLQNMYQNPQSAAQVADGTSKHYRQLFSPGKEPKVRAALHCTWLVLCRKKNECFFKIYVVCFLIYHSWPTWSSTARFSIQFSRVIFDMSFSQDNLKNLPNEVFCIALCLGEVTILNGGSERSFLLTNFVLKKCHFVQNRFLLFFPLINFLICFSYTDKNDYITNSNSQVQGFIWMNKKEKGT